MFEITSDDIAQLNDEDLRAVVARLCQAEMREHGYSASCVTWGGNQNATDGGIDVRVTFPAGLANSGFVPCAATGFQVKRQDMPASNIAAEMRPNDLLRPSIQELAIQSGAYIIVSSQGSTSDTALIDRRAAMRTAVADERDGDKLFVDFYDRRRLADWVCGYEAIIPWVRTLVGRSIQGWQSYGSWACAPGTVTGEYLVDDKLRIQPARRETTSGFSALGGIQQIRSELSQAQHVVRLVGLSGVGKTRFVQALFDDRVGEHSLDPSRAFYTNMSDGPDPQPVHLVSELVAGGTRAILVIDNCPPELHHRISELCRGPKSNVSVITVEYDIREDEPEGTEVFRLESSSPDLIEKLLRQWFPDISAIDAHTVACAELSGGNASIAIALAATIKHTGTVAGLTDDQLFQRLFQQRQAHDQSFYLAAQACALVYSFQGQDVSDTDDAELARLGRLIGKNSQDVYRAVAELQRRGLLQQRSVWRAVLPHAVANRLAITALQNVPYTQIENHLMGSARLMKSFSRRLGYLNTSKEAVGIIGKWLESGGLLGNAANLNELGRRMLRDVAPVAPGEALAALERMISGAAGEGAVKECKYYCDLLRSLAYDAALFERCIALLVKILLENGLGPEAPETRLFISLFAMRFSGTHATIEQRVAVIETLLASRDAARRVLGVLALKAILQASGFYSTRNFDFGAQTRDFGYWPCGRDEVLHWFRVSLKLVRTFVREDEPVASQVRTALAESLRGLWLGTEIADEIADICGEVGTRRSWPEGWLAVRQILDLNCDGENEDRLAKLDAIEAALRPTELSQKVRAMVFSTRLQGVDLDDFEVDTTADIGTRMQRTEECARSLGRAVAAEEPIFAELLPEMVTLDGRLWSFGRGLSENARDVEAVWNQLVKGLGDTEESLQKPQVLNGFLHQLRVDNPVLAERLLDDAVTHETLARCYPFLQIAVQLGKRDIERLKRSLARGRTPAHMYRHLAYGGASDAVPALDLNELILTISALSSGYDAAAEILYMRLHSDQARKYETGPELIDAGCELMAQITFTKKNDRYDYRLGEIAKYCLKSEKGYAVTTEVCQRLKAAIARYDTNAFYHDDLLVGLFSAQPTAALDGLCGGDLKELEQGVSILRHAGIRKQPLGVVSDEELLRWCNREPHARYPEVAQVVTISRRAGANTPLMWTTTALRFLENAPEPDAILRQFILAFRPSCGWSGSLCAILEDHATLLDQLAGYPQLRQAVAEQKELLPKWIDAERRQEAAFNRIHDERFE